METGVFLFSFGLSFILGAIVGSFLNVLVYRYGTGRSIVSGRSACLVCGHKLSFFELIPVASFIMQKGRCLKCGARISWQYPLVETITGLVFFSVFYRSSLGHESLLVISYLLFAFSLLVAITVYDFRHKIIPNGLVWTLIFLSLVKVLILGNFSLTYDLAAGPLLALPFFLIWVLSRGRAMGFGDAKLALGIGWMLGATLGLSALLLSFWIGGLISVFLLIARSTRFNMKSEIPFAPFLVAGVFLSYFFNLDIAGIMQFFG